MEMKGGRGFHELSIHLTNPMVMVAVETKERGRIAYDAAVRLLLNKAEEQNQEPLMRYGDGEPATYLGLANEGVLLDEETAILVMPTKHKRG